MAWHRAVEDVPARRRRLRWFAAVVTGGALLVASVITGAIATPGRIVALGDPRESTVVTVDPTRVLDTRVDVGLAGPLTSLASRQLQITGPITTIDRYTANGTAVVTSEQIVVPAGATGVLLNITAVTPSATGFLSVRPGDATGAPSTAGLNFDPGDTIPNALTVALPTTGTGSGMIDLYYGAEFPGQTVHVVIDIVGYTSDAGLLDIIGRIEALENSGVTGPPGPTGPKGDQGDPGPAGADAPRPAQVVVVATSGGDFASLSAALASIDDNSAATPYVIRIAPGTYTETGPVFLADHVDIEGAGRDRTVLECACAGPVNDSSSATLSAVGPITSEVRHLTVSNTGTGEFSTAIWTESAAAELSLLHVAANATGGTFSIAVQNNASSPTIADLSAAATDSVESYGVFNDNGSFPTMTDVTASADNSNEGFGVLNLGSAPTMRNLSVTVSGNGVGFGVANRDTTQLPLLSAATIVADGPECYGVVNDAASTEMEDVGIFLRCDGELFGVHNLNGSDARLHDVDITAQSPPGVTYAVFTGVLNDGSAPNLNSMIITSDVGDENYAVRNVGSEVTIANVTTNIRSGTTTNAGVFNESASAVSVHTSSILALGFGSLAVFNLDTSTALVTDSALDGVIVGPGLTCIGAHTSTGLELARNCVDLAAASSPARVIWVAESGGEFTSLSAALDAIGTTLPAATAGSPYVVKIAPGIYTETDPIFLKDFVDIEGSGRDVTTLTCACVDQPTMEANGPLTAEVRQLTVASSGGGATAIGLRTSNIAHGTLSLRDLTVTAIGGTVSNRGVDNASSSPTMRDLTIAATGGTSTGVHNHSSSPQMDDVTISSAAGATDNGFGMYNVSSSPTMDGVTVAATGGTNTFGIVNEQAAFPTMERVTITATGGSNASIGVYNTESVMTIRDSSVSSAVSIENGDATTGAYVATTRLDGPVSGPGFACVGAYDVNFTALDATCR